MKPLYLPFRMAALAALIALCLTGQTGKHKFSRHEKAFYISPQVIDFITPGLIITVNSAAIASDGSITVVYSLSDPNGLPLDSTGATTPGPVSVSYVAAVLPANEEDYTSYTTRAATGTVIASTQQPGADSGGTATPLRAGQYKYVFKTKAPSGFDAAATHTIGIYGSRNLSVFSLPANYASATYNFVPNGAPVTHIHDIVATASCNTCHDQLSAHGGSRRGMNMCVLCHTPQNTDPNTGDTMDAKVFFHKIHMGSNLPSVIAGTPYVPAINQFGTFDYSNVNFPADPGDPRRCETCHSQTSGVAHATAFLSNPSRAACGACHDDVNFATGDNHPGGPQPDDNLCSTCHIPQGEIDFDASILGAHVAPIASSLISGVVLKITRVVGTAGTAPVVSFNVRDRNGKPLPLAGLEDLSFTLAGPTTDYGYTSFGQDVTTPGYVNEDGTSAACDVNVNCTFTFQHTIPAGATGSFAVGGETERLETVLAGTTSEQTIESGAPNPVFYFPVDGSTVQDRRTIVATGNCNQCHVFLQAHGARRNNTEYCVMCHNPSNTDASARAGATVASDSAAPAQGINFNLLVHRIHYGINMQASNRTYVVVGFMGSHNDFSGTLFPALSPMGDPTDTRNCSLCHVNSTEQNDLTLTGLNKVIDPQGPVNPNPPISSACSGCHVDLASASHMLSNTTSLGEACAVCHSSGAAYAVDQVHAQY